MVEPLAPDLERIVPFRSGLRLLQLRRQPYVSEMGEAARLAGIRHRLLEKLPERRLAPFAAAVARVGVVEVETVETGLLHAITHHLLEIVHELPAFETRLPAIVVVAVGAHAPVVVARRPFLKIRHLVKHRLPVERGELAVAENLHAVGMGLARKVAGARHLGTFVLKAEPLEEMAIDHIHANARDLPDQLVAM